MIGRIVENLLILALMTALARSGREVLGIYYFARAIGSMAVDLCELGLSRYTVRTLADDAGAYRRVFGLIAAARVVTAASGFLIVASFVVCFLNSDPRMAKSALVLSGAFLLVALADLFLDVVRARQEMLAPVLLSASHKGLLVTFSILGLQQGRGIDWVIFTVLISSAAYAATCLGLVVWRHGIPKMTAGAVRLQRLAREAKPFALRTLLAVLNGKIVLWLLYAFGNSATLGEYAAVFYLIEALMMFAFAVSSAAFPRLAAEFKATGKLQADGPAASVKVLLLFIAPIAAGTALLSHKIIPALYGSGYAHTVPLLRIGIWSAVALFLNALLFTILQAVGQTKTAAWLLGPTIVINVMLGTFLISRFGATGAVWTTVAAEWSLVALHLTALRRWLNVSELFKNLGGLLVCLAGLAIIVAMFEGHRLAVPVSLGAVAYGILCWHFCPLAAKDLSWLRSTVTKVRAGF